MIKEHKKQKKRRVKKPERRKSQKPVPKKDEKKIYQPAACHVHDSGALHRSVRQRKGTGDDGRRRHRGAAGTGGGTGAF